MQLLLNKTSLEVVNPQPDTTLLNWLRDSQHLNATKEGCAVGDCGACTVIVGHLKEGAIHYESVNACIAMLGSLHGCHVITLDSLQSQTLHPVQKALVDCHASQCGFCSPGFVMSLVVWWLNTPANSLTTPAQFSQHRHGVELALSGNLCRCTGYAPILKAADQLAPLDRSTDPLFSGLGGYDYCLAQLQAMASAAPNQPHYQMPNNTHELALAYEANPSAKLVAGSTDLALGITHGLAHMPHLIDITKVKELQVLEVIDNQLHIGASVTLSALEQLCLTQWPMLASYLARFASRQVRNRATLVGNIANSSPIADMPPLLLVMGAQLVLEGVNKQRTIALEQFNLAYKETALAGDEFIHKVIMPLPDRPHRPDALGVQEGQNSQAKKQQVFIEKVSKRFEDDISAACVALNIITQNNTITHIKIACGGMAATPKMAQVTQSQLLGQTLSIELINQVPMWLSQDYQPIDDMRASAAYRSQVTANLVQGFLKEAML